MTALLPGSSINRPGPSTGSGVLPAAGADTLTRLRYALARTPALLCLDFTLLFEPRFAQAAQAAGSVWPTGSPRTDGPTRIVASAAGMVMNPEGRPRMTGTPVVAHFAMTRPGPRGQRDRAAFRDAVARLIKTAGTVTPVIWAHALRPQSSERALAAHLCPGVEPLDLQALVRAAAGAAPDSRLAQDVASVGGLADRRLIELRAQKANQPAALVLVGLLAESLEALGTAGLLASRPEESTVGSAAPIGTSETLELPAPTTPYTGWPTRFADSLATLATDSSFAQQLDQAGIESFGLGGCAILAEAMRRALGPSAHLVGVRERSAPRVEHVAVECFGWYLDAYGVRDGDEFIEDAHQIGGYQDPVIAPFELSTVAANLIPYARAQGIVSMLLFRFAPLAWPDPSMGPSEHRAPTGPPGEIETRKPEGVPVDESPFLPRGRPMSELINQPDPAAWPHPPFSRDDQEDLSDLEDESGSDEAPLPPSPVVVRAALLYMANSRLLVYDTETTGLVRVGPDGRALGTAPRIWDLAAIPVRAQGEPDGEAQSWLIRLKEPIPNEANVSGVDPRLPVESGQPVALALTGFSALAHNRVLIAHNGALFDDPIMRAAYAGRGLPEPRSLQEPAWNFDTLPLARMLLPGPHRLGNVAETLGITGVWSHRASGDAELLAQLVLALLRRAAVELGFEKDPVAALALARSLDPGRAAGPAELYNYKARTCPDCSLTEMVNADIAARGPRCEPCYRLLHPRKS